MSGLDVLKEQLRARLRPVATGASDRDGRRSDYDLNPTVARFGGTLRQAAVLIPVIARPEGAMTLLTRRADTLASHTGQVAFPGGRLDPGETAVEAALREAWEEVALDREAVEVLGLGDPYETWTGFLITPVIGWLSEPPFVSPSPDEVAEVFEVPWDFLMDPANHWRDSLERGGEQRWFWAMPYGQHHIWGVTAGIIRALRARLHGETAGAEDAA